MAHPLKMQTYIIKIIFAYISELTIVEQKTLKTELEIAKEQQITGEVNKSIAALQNKMVHLSNKLIGKKGYSNVLNKETALMQTNFLQTLKVIKERRKIGLRRRKSLLLTTKPVRLILIAANV